MIILGFTNYAWPTSSGSATFYQDTKIVKALPNIYKFFLQSPSGRHALFLSMCENCLKKKKTSVQIAVKNGVPIHFLSSSTRKCFHIIVTLVEKRLHKNMNKKCRRYDRYRAGGGLPPTWTHPWPGSG